MNAGEGEASQLAPGVTYRELVGAATRHRTEASFRASAFFRAHGADLERILLTPRVEPPVGRSDGVSADAGQDRAGQNGYASIDPGSLRVLQWNIEKGRELDGIIRRLREDPWASRADLLLLNEVDHGTARGGNRDQARVLAATLGMHHAWLPTYIECTKGTGADLSAEGENTLGLHGLAILSRWPITAARAAALPSCHDYFDFHEKKFGGRRGLYALIAAGDRRFVAATTHLEVRRTPRCRAGQFAAFLRGLDESLLAWAGDGLLSGQGDAVVVRKNAAGGISPVRAGAADPREAVILEGDRSAEASPVIFGDGRNNRSIPVILGGDWNTSTFRRGTLALSAVEFLRLVTTPAVELAAQLVKPFSREPLFALLAAEGFVVTPYNEAVPTVAQDLGSVEDLAVLPASVARGIARAFGLSGRVLRMRLDWFAVRGLQACDRPVTLPATGTDGHTLSDHAAIGIDLTGI